MRSLLGCEVRTSRPLRRGGGHPKTLRLTSGPNSSGAVNRVRIHAGDPAIFVRTVTPHYLTDYSRWRHPAARFGRFANDFPVSAAGLCIQRIAPDSETRLQKVGSLRSAFLASR